MCYYASCGWVFISVVTASAAEWVIHWTALSHSLRKLIVSRNVAESIGTDAGRFNHVGLCQLRTKLLRS